MTPLAPLVTNFFGIILRLKGRQPAYYRKLQLRIQVPVPICQR